ncbi:MarR family transcriptional regulator [Mumia sp. zg.B17]|uniref:MarR family winged helix-turn-helix transcriptional regulator n=1 Tax=unclassified Mumia TaxID=2621872 RepID=UPI001C6F5071|nr:MULTISPECIES: MarR family transcriptional regulator [unclassified Mumia]MBW9207323.1 MarR family transcriptional regulator [Mumia sp. zg.B17]MDD9347331.1 MarR family transcriptional regulator [Mumia sp.]
MDLAHAPRRMTALPSWLLAQAASASGRIVAAALGEAGAHRSHYAVLVALDERGPMSQSALSDSIGVDRSDMVRLLDILGNEGLVVREPDSEDRRRNLIALTPTGRTRLGALDRILAAAQADATARLTSDERDRLVDLLRKLLGA